jgi:hypothetical protein
VFFCPFTSFNCSLDKSGVLKSTSLTVLAENLVVELYQNLTTKNVTDIRRVLFVMGFGPVYCYSNLSSQQRRRSFSVFTLHCDPTWFTIIHSLHSPSCDRYLYSSRASSPNSAIFSFNFQYVLFALSYSSNCLRLLPRLLKPYFYPSVRCFGKQFLLKM